MKRNVGGLDRIGRIVIGIIAGIAGVAILAGYWKIGAVFGGIALVVGIILLITGTTQKCPINDVAGIDTTK
ncbi:MAG: DUF2892 domain-containing protein [Halobacteriaceae archaeon]